MAYNYEYPYTDPYRYNDDWLLRKMKDLIEEWAAMKKQFADLQTAFNDLKTYVMNYFANLDVQEEVEVVLNKWLADGTIQSLINNYLFNYKGAFFSSANGVIIVGGKYLHDGLATGTTIPAGKYIALQMQYDAVDLSDSNASLMGPGSLSYYNILAEWKEQHPNYLKDGYKTCFIALEKSDMNYSRTQISAAMIAIDNMMGMTMILLPYLMPNTDFNIKHLQFYQWLQSLTVIRANKCIIPPTCPGEYDSIPYYLSDSVLSGEGVYALTLKVLTSFLINSDTTYPGYLSKTVDNNYFNIAFRSPQNYSMIANYTGKVHSNTDISLDFGIVMFDEQFFMAYTHNTHSPVYLHLHSGKIDIQCGEGLLSDGEYIAGSVPFSIIINSGYPSE